MKQRTSDLTLSIVKCTQQRFNLRTVTITTIAAFWYKLTFIPWYKFSEDRITAFGYKYGISERCGWFYNCVVTSTPQCSQVHKTFKLKVCKIIFCYYLVLAMSRWTVGKNRLLDRLQRGPVTTSHGTHCCRVADYLTNLTRLRKLDYKNSGIALVHSAVQTQLSVRIRDTTVLAVCEAPR